MLKAKFALNPAAVMPLIDRHNADGGEPDAFLVEAVKYNSEQCIVVGQAQPIMYLIGQCANAGFDSLMDVSSL